MRGSWLLGMISLLVVLSGCRSDQAADTGLVPQVPSPDSSGFLERFELSAEPAEPILLRYRPISQTRHQVKLHQASVQEREGKDLTFGTDQRFVLERQLVAEEGESWRVKMALSGLHVEPDGPSRDKEMSAALESVRAALEGTSFTVLTNGRGEVLEFKLGGGEGQRWRGMADLLEQLVRESILELPAEPVAPGASWEATRQSRLERPKTSNLVEHRLRSTFLGYAAVPGHGGRCAVIRTTGEFTINGEITVPGMSGTSRGEGKSEAVLVLDPGAGLLVASLVATSSKQSYLMGGAQGGELGFAESMTTRMEQELLPAADAVGVAAPGEH